MNLRYVVGRPLMLILWALVLWGSLCVVAVSWLAATHGLGAAIAVVKPRPGSGVLAWGNVLLMPFAVVAWCLVVGVVARIKRGAAKPSAPANGAGVSR